MPRQIKAEYSKYQLHKDTLMVVIPLPKFTDTAKKRWNGLNETNRKLILETTWCPSCKNGICMQLHEAKMLGRSLLLRGICKECGHDVARVVEPDD